MTPLSSTLVESDAWTLRNGADMVEQTLYKLTNENGCTFGCTRWGPGIKNVATGDQRQDLYSDGWIHAYESPLLAVLMNPLHAAFQNPKLWEARGVIGKREGQLQCGCRTVTTIRELPLPAVTEEQRIRFAIYCALAVSTNEYFITWAHNWLNGVGRSEVVSENVIEGEVDSDAQRAVQTAVYVPWSIQPGSTAACAAFAANKVKGMSIDFISLAQKAVSQER